MMKGMLYDLPRRTSRIAVPAILATVACCDFDPDEVHYRLERIIEAAVEAVLIVQRDVLLDSSRN